MTKFIKGFSIGDKGSDYIQQYISTLEHNPGVGYIKHFKFNKAHII
jgi:hypothetical protein